MLSLALLIFLVFFRFFSPLLQFDHLAWGRESWSMCIACFCLFILHTLVFVLFLSLLVSGVGCDLLLWHSLDFSINFVSNILEAE